MTTLPYNSHASALLQKLFPLIRKERESNPRWAYGGFAEYVIKKGRLHPSQPLNKEERIHLRETAEKLAAVAKPGVQFRPGDEAAYARILAFLDRQQKLQYTEGYLLDAPEAEPKHHVYLTLDGKVIDPMNGVEGGYPDGKVYFGVALPTTYLVRRVFRERTYNGPSIILDRDGDYPLLKAGILPVGDGDAPEITEVASPNSWKWAYPDLPPVVQARSR